MEAIITIQNLNVVVMVRYLMVLLDISAVDLPCTDCLLRYAVTTMSYQNPIFRTLDAVALMSMIQENVFAVLVIFARSLVVVHVVAV